MGQVHIYHHGVSLSLLYNAANLGLSWGILCIACAVVLVLHRLQSFNVIQDNVIQDNVMQ